MKNYRVRALREFNDVVEGKLRSPKNENAEFFCDKERYEYLVSKKAVELLEVQETIDDITEDEITEEEVQAVASAIVEEAQEEGKSVEEVVNEIVEETTEEPEVQDEVEEETQEDAVVNEIIKKNKSSKK